jgi:excisionase family DNA binding protein
MIETGKFYSLEDIAQMLAVTYQSVYKLVRSGELGALRVGKVYRVSERDLASYLERQREQVKKEVAATICSVCGKGYYSSLSITSECKICGLPICRNCAELENAEYCETHAKKTPGVER